ncbi:MAG: hypothetical protein WCA27_18270, partial [Candidatus Sulfotelmatobacter sp.]
SADRDPKPSIHSGQLRSSILSFQDRDLLPKDVLKNPSIRIDARGFGGEFRAVPVTDSKAVKSVIEKFREKYGAKDVKKYYSKFDAAVFVELG